MSLVKWILLVGEIPTSLIIIMVINGMIILTVPICKWTTCWGSTWCTIWKVCCRTRHYYATINKSSDTPITFRQSYQTQLIKSNWTISFAIVFPRLEVHKIYDSPLKITMFRYLKHVTQEVLCLPHFRTYSWVTWPKNDLCRPGESGWTSAVGDTECVTQ